MCPVCGKNKVQRHSIYGLLPCNDCSSKRNQNKLPDKQIEFTGKNIKEERSKFAKSIIQPWRSGEASKEFIDLYPEKAKRMFTKKELKTAKPVWKDLYSSNVDLKKTK